MLHRGSLPTLCALVLWIGGCPKRPGPASIVFVPAPAPQATPSQPTAAPPQVMVIEEPAPPEGEPEETIPAQVPEHPPQHRRTRPAHTEVPAVPEEPATPEAPEPPPAEVPALEPRESTAQAIALRQQVLQLQDDVRRRLARLIPARLSSTERKTLEDARTFFAQSARALEESDLQRALNLARKASLLVTALE